MKIQLKVFYKVALQPYFVHYNHFAIVKQKKMHFADKRKQRHEWMNFLRILVGEEYESE